jgi:hypothetical protein
MSSTININDLTLAHKGSSGTAAATLPDACKTPSPGGPVPLPYPNIAQSSDLAKGTTTIKVDGGNMAANKGSELARSTGDEAGSIGGVTSSTFIKEATWMLYSFDVMLEGKNACRLSDKLFMNHENTVCLGGWMQNYLTGPNKNKTDADACVALRQYIEYELGEGRTGEGGAPPGTARKRGLEERIGQNTEGGSLGAAGAPNAPKVPIPGRVEPMNAWDTHNEEIAKSKAEIKKHVAEYEADCPSTRESRKLMDKANEKVEEAPLTAADWKPK